MESSPEREKMSRVMRNPAICTGENKGADQLRTKCEADQRLCFHHMDSTILVLAIILVLAKIKIS